jgi:arginyl-tRNA synthetase
MEYPYQRIKNHIQKTIQITLKKLEFPSDVKLEEPPSLIADFAFPCFSLCKFSKCSPDKTAEIIASKINPDSIIKSISATNGYINFTIQDKSFINDTLQLIHKKKETYGNFSKLHKNVIIEHTSANPTGRLHVGRARNPIIGDTIVRIYKAAGYNVESQFYLDDLGKQVAILTWGINNKDIIISNDISKFYPGGSTIVKNNLKNHDRVVFYQVSSNLMKEDSKVAEEINEIVKHAERGEQNTIEMVKNAYKPELERIKESLMRINITIDKYVPESDFVKDKRIDDVVNVDDVVKKLKKLPHCDIEDGAYYLDMKHYGIQGRNTKFFFLRKDGTSLYATRDIAYHLWKAKNADILINILGEDHKLESKQVEIALNLIGAEIIPNVIFYSFVSLPGGKMSTRQARVVYLDDLIKECVDRAYKEVKNRRGMELSEKKMKEIAEVVGIGALRYNIIKVQPEKDIVFKWEEALNFEGNAAPFIQYAHARAAGILSKKPDDVDIKSFDEITMLSHPSEINLCKQLALFPQIILDAAEGFKPHLMASYVYETAGLFNQFYRDCPVLSEKNIQLRNERLILVSAVKQVLLNGLDLLGITAPDEM